MSSATYVNPEGKKYFVPLENNADVMTKLVHRLGLSQDVQFYDVYSIDEPDLLALVPRPVQALIVIVPMEIYCAARDVENQETPEYSRSGPDEPVLWFKQTIGNACGLWALLHSALNGEAKAFINPGSLLDRLRAAAIPLAPAARSKLLYDSVDLEVAHQESAQEGDSAAPAAAEPNDLAFISFAKGDDGHLWELFGGNGCHGPADRGQLDATDDVLSDKALDLGMKNFMRVAKQNGIGDLRLSIVALAMAQNH